MGFVYAVISMGPVQAALAAFAALIGIVGILGICVVWLRRSISTERDDARVNTISALREVADVEERLNEARLAAEREWVERLERHHAITHRRCTSEPRRDG